MNHLFILFLLCGFVVAITGCCSLCVQEDKNAEFFAYVDTGEDLPEEGFYPQGRKFVYMGYSGINEQDAQNGFSVGGHHYGPMELQKKELASAKAAGLPYIYAVGLEGSFVNEKLIGFDKDALRETVKRQVLEVVDDPYVLWWYIKPEEMRMWIDEEVEYLRIAYETIRDNDPHGRPIWMYDPNHRTADYLKRTGKYLDIIGKGCYVNRIGNMDSRIWVRWTMDQETTACEDLESLDGRKRTPIVMPEMIFAPEDTALDPLIPAWARHDTYLGLMTGAKGVCIFSLFPRPELKRTHKEYYDAYSKIGKELTGDLDLGKVFLFGQSRDNLSIEQLSGLQEVQLYTGPRNEVEKNTMSEEEMKKHLLHYPALTTKEITYAGKVYLFLCNSSKDPMACRIAGIPKGETISVVELFHNQPIDAPKGTCEINLGPWGAKCIGISN